jgi:uncharacterized surface protein with fasciclin (FAS1) repeats
VLGEETINALLGDTDRLSDILLYHVISGSAVDSETAIGLAGTTVTMANEDSVAITLQGDSLFINNAQVVTADIEASNGIIHVIDAVLLPPADPEPLASITATAAANGSFTTLVAALQATGLDAALADETMTYTVFAPTDSAFEALGEDTINALLSDLDTLSDILLYHVIPDSSVDAVTALSLAGTEVAMANGALAALSLTEGELFINQAKVVVTDVAASNGVIHVIDAVITPPAEELGNIAEVAAAAGSFTTLLAALEATGLDEVVADESGIFTVFAPTDAAFALLGEETINALLVDTDTLSDILLYHVLTDSAVDAETAISLAGSDVEMANGETVSLSIRDGALYINEAQVIATDIEASNGIIHVIDAVIVPPADELGTIAEVAAASGNFSTLLAALGATGLDAALADETAVYTVFAPTDAAFEALGQDTIDSLLNDLDTLSDILLYHVIADSAINAETALSLATATGTPVEMANGDSAVLSLSDGVLLVNDAQVIATDVPASNGIIHVIDMVITPPG